MSTKLSLTHDLEATRRFLTREGFAPADMMGMGTSGTDLRKTVTDDEGSVERRILLFPSDDAATVHEDYRDGKGWQKLADCTLADLEAELTALGFVPIYCPNCGEPGGTPRISYSREYQGVSPHGGVVEFTEEGCTKCL